MKDITITGKAIKREVIYFIISFVAAVCMNIFAIIKYSRPAIELLSMIGFVIVAAVLIYVTLAVIRLIVSLVIRIVKKIMK